MPPGVTPYKLTEFGGAPPSTDNATLELLRDVDTLSREVSGSFYLIFDREFTSPLELSEEVFPVGVAGEGERTLEATRTEVRNVVNEQSGRQRSVCLVTADKSLAESVSGPGVHFVQLSDFFQT